MKSDCSLSFVQRFGKARRLNVHSTSSVYYRDLKGKNATNTARYSRVSYKDFAGM